MTGGENYLLHYQIAFYQIALSQKQIPYILKIRRNYGLVKSNRILKFNMRLKIH